MSIESLSVVVLVLCVAVTLLVVLVLALARQIGVLHTRLAPAGALMNTSVGPDVGTPAPKLSLQDINGTPVQIGGPSASPLLILFVSPNCPICKELVPVARSMARAEKLRLLFASDGGEIDKHIEYVSKMDIADYPYLLSSELGLKFAASKLPYAALIDSDGVLRSRGLVNSREHLESLVESMLSGYDSLQDYLVKEQQLEQAS
ncbi:MAG: methylamine dehydrogenase accessory protein MauD [Glaciecola sp.]|jgi:methylamine dehydrogenase accessory protein MauD|uniref:thiol-disulfide isomerase n=1 Tax=Congregibacter sp. TaxID=2744308 RepID=UPI0039E2E8D0